MPERRKVFILLTRFPDATSRVLHFCTGFYYTHASIGLEEDMNTFYSFVVKGFIVEKVTRYIRPDREPYPCLLYELEVSEEVYWRIKKILRSFIERKGSLHYTRLGVILCLFHISCKWKNHYFCSQFVAEVLKFSSAVCMKKGSELFLPRDFKNLPGIRERFQGNLCGMIKQFGIAS